MGKCLRLQVLAFARHDEIVRVVRCMEAQETDCTSGVDVTGRHLMKVVCQGADKRTYTTLECFLLTQRADNFRFTLHSCLRVLYGEALMGIEAFASDGDGVLTEVWSFAVLACTVLPGSRTDGCMATRANRVCVLAYFAPCHKVIDGLKGKWGISFYRIRCR